MLPEFQRYMFIEGILENGRFQSQLIFEKVDRKKLGQKSSKGTND